MLRNHRRKLGLQIDSGQILHLNPSEPTHPSKPPRLPYLASTSPPTLTLFSPSLAPKRPPHAHLVDRPARRSGLVPCVVLPHGLAGLALRRALWRKPANRYDEWLNRELLLCCACGMYVCVRARGPGAYVRTCCRVADVVWCGVFVNGNGKGSGNGRKGRCHRLSFFLSNLSLPYLTLPYVTSPFFAHVVWLGVMLACLLQ
jgi:hypothetical protein